MLPPPAQRKSPFPFSEPNLGQALARPPVAPGENPEMLLPVRDQIPDEREALGAQSALVNLGRRVALVVARQLGHLDEALAADPAGVPLPAVALQVFVQRSFVREAFGAAQTPEQLLLVELHVSRPRPRGRQRLAAAVALVERWSEEGARLVEPHVSSELPFSGERHPTVRALVPRRLAGLPQQRARLVLQLVLQERRQVRVDLAADQAAVGAPQRPVDRGARRGRALHPARLPALSGAAARVYGPAFLAAAVAIADPQVQACVSVRLDLLFHLLVVFHGVLMKVSVEAFQAREPKPTLPTRVYVLLDYNRRKKDNFSSGDSHLQFS